MSVATGAVVSASGDGVAQEESSMSAQSTEHDARPFAVVFDCDGVLVDSEGLAWDAWRHELRRHDIRVDQDDVRALTGRTADEVYAHFAAGRSLPESADLKAAVHRETLRRIRGELEPFEDAVATVRALAATRTPLAVASSSVRERLDAALRRTGVAQLFDGTVAGDEVEYGKPAPDLYLAAAAALDVDPARCTAVEDTPSGIASAQAAGMRVVAVKRPHMDPGALADADVVVAELDPKALWGR
jgi:HAD superfamily hydrolase (TIGR01509 family)